MRILVNIKFVVPDEWSTNQKGEFFEREVGRILSKLRYEITERIQFTGIEIDFLAKNKDTYQRAFVECKFLADKLTSGVITDLLGKAAIRDADMAYLFSVSDPGKEAKGVIEEIKAKPLKSGLIFAFIGPEKIGEMYLEILNVGSIESRLSCITISEKQIGSTTLVISPNNDFLVIEYINNNIPESLVLLSLKESEFIDIIQIRKLLDENKLWLGLKCLNAEDWRKQRSSSTRGATHKGDAPEIRETISQIPQADQFDDYRPCRPEDFVGRSQLQKDIWDFLEKARSNDTNTRIISLVGPSGFGKSSLIIKLSNRFRNVRWKNKFYIFHVDTRSAATPFFIAEAILKAFTDAQKDRFIELNEILSIDSIDSPIRSKLILKSINYLKNNEKVLLIFF